MKFFIAAMFLLISFQSIAHSPKKFNTQDFYFIGNVLNPSYEGGDMYEVFELTPGIGLGIALKDITLGYGQFYIEGGYNYLGTYNRDVYEDSPPSLFYMYQHEETLENIYINFKLSYPLSDSILMNLKFGHSYLNSKFSTSEKTDRGALLDIPDQSYSQSTNMTGFGFEYLINNNISLLYESINYGSGVRSLVASLLIRL
jgi:hypothetical protein